MSEQNETVSKAKFQKLAAFVREMARQFNELEAKVTDLTVKVERIQTKLDSVFGEDALLERVKELERKVNGVGKK